MARLIVLASSTTPCHYAARLNSDVRPLKIVASILAALLGFAAGCVAVPVILMWAFAPGADCPSPCDAPAYVALGLAIFVAPPTGVLVGGLAVWAVHSIWPAKKRASTA